MLNGMPADIFVVEDNDSQRASIVTSLLNAVGDLSIVEVSDGKEAVNLLTCDPDEPPPCLVLLDLGLPDGSAFDVLEHIRDAQCGHPLARVPVVVFSDSQDRADIEECYRRGANSYIVKPLNHAAFQRAVEDIARYWLVLNQAPS